MLGQSKLTPLKELALGCYNNKQNQAAELPK